MFTQMLQNMFSMMFVQTVPNQLFVIGRDANRCKKNMLSLESTHHDVKLVFCLVGSHEDLQSKHGLLAVSYAIDTKTNASL